MDLFPTMLSLVGVGPMKVAGPPDGISAFDWLRRSWRSGAGCRGGDRPFYFHSARKGYQTPRAQEGQVIEAVSDGRMKFVSERFDVPRELLYDLTSDPGEERPLLAGDEIDAARARLDEVREALKG